MNTALLSEIDDFLRATGMGASYFGKRAVRNSELVKRLRDGKKVWPDTEMQVRAFMLAERKRRRKPTPEPIPASKSEEANAA